MNKTVNLNIPETADERANLSSLLASLSEKEKNGLTWGNRGNGKSWHASKDGKSTIGNGGPYATAADAVRAVLGKLAHT